MKELKSTLIKIFAIIGAIAAIAGILYGLYCYFTPDYLEDFEEDDFDDEDFFEDEDDAE